jgi:sRNA-binding regulator protein Hfq
MYSAEPRSHENAPAAFDRTGKPYQPSSAPRRSSSSSGSSQPRVSGHDSVLRAIQNQGRATHVILLSGDELHGPIVGRDKFTITLRIDTNPPQRRLIFKHAIEQLWADETPATQDDTNDE